MNEIINEIENFNLNTDIILIQKIIRRFLAKNTVLKLLNKNNYLKNKKSGSFNKNNNGKKFEEKTNNELKLLEDGYIKILINKNKKQKYNYYLFKELENIKIIYTLQTGLKLYIKQKYNIELFRYPDEAYIIEYNKKYINKKNKIIILEKKEQQVEGSVETKLWSGPSLKREYELILDNKFEVIYSFCINDFLKKKILSNEKKYIILNIILKENNINIHFGDDDNYWNNFNNWFNNLI